ncbi:hypothetical protein [Mammaliicoccus vitulinus]|uniref:hypothetical protein n=1 Tax=Mammaliicoccus vitulinus TaxID=71237 RepID=UPI00248C2E45|nr:hypothetical protein [Mammaliicoccus vitulinus]
MADSRKIIIEIVGNGSTSSSYNKSSVLSDKDNGQESRYDISDFLHPIKTFESKVLSKFLLANYTINNSVNLIKRAATQTIDRYFSLSEDYLNESVYNNAMTALSNVGSVVSSVASGIQIGSVGGAPGMIIGAAIGLTSSLVSLDLQYKSRLSSYYTQLNATNIQTKFTAARMGLLDGGRNTEN